MEAFRRLVNFSFVIMLDDIYGRHSPEDFARKFKEPYEPQLLPAQPAS
jgi:hypothetical protein